jgi:hypothetical protein
LAVCALFGVGHIRHVPEFHPLAFESASVGPAY